MSNNLSQLKPILLSLFITGCSSTSDDIPEFMEKDIDYSFMDTFGFKVKFIDDDYYQIKYKENALWAFSGFESTWRQWDQKAQEVCGSKKHIKRYPEEKKGNDPQMGWTVSVTAYADCSGNAEQIMLKKKKKLF